MASSKKRRGYKKNLLIRILSAVLYLCILLSCAVIGLQVYHLISPPTAVTTPPSLIGNVTVPFTFTPTTVIPFMMIPLLALVFITMFVQRFFLHNGFGFSDVILMFEKHPHTRLSKKACKLYLIISVLISFVLCVLCSAMHGIHTVWLGLIIVSASGFLHFTCAKMMRHYRRLYHHNKKKTKDPA